MENKKFKYPGMILLGSTGSIGEQALDVAEKNGIRIDALACGKNYKRLEEQARKFKVKACAASDKNSAKELKIALSDTDIKVYSGEDGICRMIEETNGGYHEDQVVLNSIIGCAGLKPTLTTLSVRKKLALANKESLVAGGHIVMPLARRNEIEILPVDSEHSAIFQALRSGRKDEIKRLILTASGGPFFGYTKEQLENITPSDALAHPTWRMGARITIDSSTLMNKGFEVIEAVHLFDVSPDKIEVVVHRESIIHSAVEYIDNSIIAQLSKPDMRECVQYALTHPKRAEATIGELDLFKVGKLTFMPPDTEVFRLLDVAKDAIRQGGALPAVMNASDEIAVEAFIKGKISYPHIAETVIKTMDILSSAAKENSREAIFEYDSIARKKALEIVNG